MSCFLPANTASRATHEALRMLWWSGLKPLVGRDGGHLSRRPRATGRKIEGRRDSGGADASLFVRSGEKDEWLSRLASGRQVYQSLPAPLRRAKGQNARSRA